MIAGSDIALLRPLWLLALPLVAVAGWWLYTRSRGLGDWQRASDPALLRALRALGKVETRASRLPLVATLGVAVLVILALAGPAVERRDSLSYRNLDGVVLVVDASRSVTEDARWPQAMTMARFAIAALGTRPGGLIVFAGDAYVATDLTLDHLQLGQTVSLIDENTVPDPGSRPARALALAGDLMRNAGVVAGDVILLGDGAGLDRESLIEAGALAAQRARLSVVSVVPPGPQMATHAEVGGGRVFTLDDTDAMGDWLQQDARTRLMRQDYPLLFWKDYGRVLLVLALVPMLFLFRRPSA